MHHQDYELAENCWQQLRERRSKRLAANQVQQIANRIGSDVGTIQQSSRTAVSAARNEAWLAACTLASELDKQSADVDRTWEIAIARAHDWFRAAE